MPSPTAATATPLALEPVSVPSAVITPLLETPHSLTSWMASLLVVVITQYKLSGKAHDKPPAAIATLVPPTCPAAVALLSCAIGESDFGLNFQEINSSVKLLLNAAVTTR